MINAGTLALFGALFLALGWLGVGIANDSIADAATRGTPLGFREDGVYAAAPGFALISSALLVAALAGLLPGPGNRHNDG